MTTLPQTTTTRAPQARQQPLVLPNGSPPPSGGGGAPMSGADVWRIIRSNLWLILALLVVFGVGGYAANYYLAKYYPRYKAVGLVQAQPPMRFTNSPLPQDSNTPFNAKVTETELNTQARLLSQDGVFQSMLQNDPKVRTTDWYKEAIAGGPNRPLQDLRDNLSVQPVPDTNLIQIRMDASNPHDCVTIVQAVVDEYRREQENRNSNRSSDRTQLLNRLLSQYENQRNEVTASIRQKMINLALSGGVPGKLSSVELQLTDLVRKQLDLQLQTTDVQTQLALMESIIKSGGTPPSVDDLINHDPQVLQYGQQVNNLDVTISNLSVNLGPNNDAVKRAVQQRQSWQQKLEDQKAELRANATAILIEQLRSTQSRIQKQANGIDQRVKQAQEDMGQLSNDMADYLTLVDKQKLIQELIRELHEQLDAINNLAAAQNSGGVEWQQRPTLLNTMTFPRLPVTLALALAVGLALGLGIAFLRDMLDTSVRSPRDIARVGQMTLLAMIPDQSEDAQSAGARLPLIIAESPHSILAEQFRQLRTRLQHAASLDTTRSILVTSPGPGDGKSVVACNLATGLALNGRRILLVDANFRRPELHKIFGVSNAIGLADVLASTDRMEEAIQPTAIPNLSVMTCGPKLANPTELLESRLLSDLIERALEEYDHVIFDSGPLLFASETVAMAPRMDGVVSVVRARSNSRGLLQRMRDGLRQIKAEHLGVVLNAVRAQGGGYYGRNIKTYYDYMNNGH